MNRDYAHAYKIQCWTKNCLSSIRSCCSNGTKNTKKTRDKSINTKYLRELFDSQGGKCYWLGISLDPTRQDKLRTPSIDRLDNNVGYEKGNIVISSRFANLGRGNVDKDLFSLFIKSIK